MKNILKKSLSIFLTLLMLVSIAPASVITSVNAGDTITWNFDGENLVVSGSGELSATYTSTEEWKNMQDKCVNVLVEGEVKSIGDNAFKDFSAIKNVEVTGLLEKVGKNAFSNCTALESITLPDSVSIIDEFAFSGCKTLKGFQFPQNLIKINKWAFKGCECFDNKALVLPDTLQKVGYGAFSGADITSLTAPFVGVGVIKNEESINSNSIGYMFGNVSSAGTYVCRDGVYSEYYCIPNSLKEVAVTKYVYDNNFQNAKKIEKIVLKDTVEITTIPSSFVSGCQELKKLVIENPDEITRISDSAFESCYALEGFTIPENVTEISFRAFALCRFDSIEIPDKVETIGGYAFFKCVGITSVVLPNSVKSIGEYAFKGCSNLKNVKMPSTYYTIGEGAFDETQYTGTEDDFVITEEGVLTEYRGTDTDIVVPEGVTQIGMIFSGNKDIESIILPDSLLHIEENAFSGCSALTEIILPNSLECIPENSFNGCSSLTKIRLPDGLLSIKGNAFMDCSSLADIDIPDTVVEIGSRAFSDCSSLTELTIPDNLLEIKGNTFEGCCKIKELVVPDSVVKIENMAFVGMCSLERLTVPFVGESRDVESDTYKAIIGYWFDSESTYWNSDYSCPHSYNHVTQEYGHIIKEYDDNISHKYSVRIYKPQNFKELTITQGVLRSHALNNFELEILSVGENVEVIEEFAAYNLGLTELHLHEDAKFTEIPDKSFRRNSITSITIPKNVKRIGAAFGGNHLIEINLNEGLEVLDGSFESAPITSIDLPDSLTKIGRQTFKYCRNLEYIEFPENLTEIGSSAFWRAGLKEVVFPESINFIHGSAFYKCPLEKVVIPENIADIFEETFGECEELKRVVIGGKVEEIGSAAFKDCISLDTVVIPDSVISISDDAFENANEEMVIYCNEGSYAQEYAIQNNIKYTTLVLDSVPNQTYTGKEIKPEVKAKANNRPLTLNTEYKLSYNDNINVGVAGITARGLGDFKHLVAKGKFNILACQLNNITVKYEDFTYYSPNGVKIDLALYMGNNLLTEGKDYEVIGLDKVTGVGTYNIAVKGKDNISGTKNLTLDVLPRSITETKISSKEGIKVTDSKHTLVEGVDYRIEKRTSNSGAIETYVVGIGNYTDEKRVSSEDTSLGTNILYRILALFEKFFEALRNLFS